MRRAAFTLVEALVCMGLLTAAFLLIMGLFPKVLLQQKQLSYRSLAVEEAAQEMSAALAKDPTSLPAGHYPITSAPFAGELIVADVTPGVTRELEVVLKGRVPILMQNIQV